MKSLIAVLAPEHKFAVDGTAHPIEKDTADVDITAAVAS
jgi:hypothetical protein